MCENERILTIQPMPTPSYYNESFSRISLQGMWVRDLGFTAGRKVFVKSINTDNKIQIIVSLVG